MNKGNINDNSGYTLVELIITIAILGFIMVAIGGFMVSGVNMGDRGRKQIALSENSRTTISRLKEDLLDTGCCIVGVDTMTGKVNNTFYLVSRNENSTVNAVTYDIKAYRYVADAAGGKLYYGRSTGMASITSGLPTADHLLCDNIEDFTMNISRYDKTGAGSLQIPMTDEASIVLNLKKGRYTFRAEDSVAFRSQTMYYDTSTNADDMIQKITKAQEDEANGTTAGSDTTP